MQTNLILGSINQSEREKIATFERIKNPKTCFVAKLVSAEAFFFAVETFSAFLFHLLLFHLLPSISFFAIVGGEEQQKPKLDE